MPGIAVAPTPPHPQLPPLSLRRRILRGYRLLAGTLRQTPLRVLEHDCLNLAQSTAYSAIVALFPALIVAAAVVGLLPDTMPVRYQLAAFFNRILPPGVGPLLDMALQGSHDHRHSLRALVSAGFVSFFGASNVIGTLMEGLRRARELPDTWTFWERRRRAFELVPLSLLPLAIASLLVVFGHLVNGWLTPSLGPAVRTSILVAAVLLRWVVALATSVGVIALLYHLGTQDIPLDWVPLRLAQARLGGFAFPWMRHAGAHVEAPRPRHWKLALPGAVTATVMWFVTTLGFGWYLTRFANYSEVYGSLGAGIALLFWLYLISLSVLCGAEFNAQFELQRSLEDDPTTPSPAGIPTASASASDSDSSSDPRLESAPTLPAAPSASAAHPAPAPPSTSAIGPTPQPAPAPLPDPLPESPPPSSTSAPPETPPR